MDNQPNYVVEIEIGDKCHPVAWFVILEDAIAYKTFAQSTLASWAGDWQIWSVKPTSPKGEEEIKIARLLGLSIVGEL